MARSLYSIKGTLFMSTTRGEKTQSELYDEIRALPGVVTLKTTTLGKDKIALVVKVDPYPYGGKFTEEVHNKIISEIKEIPGVRKFNVYESPFVKPEPKQVYDPTPTTPQDRERSSQNQRPTVPSKPENI
jgi:hypothetical protein